jgi:hypothetical protein
MANEIYEKAREQMLNPLPAQPPPPRGAITEAGRLAAIKVFNRFASGAAIPEERASSDARDEEKDELWLSVGDLAAAFTEALAPRWHPIETAPLDTEIMVRAMRWNDGSCFVCAAAWNGTEWTHPRAAVADWSNDDLVDGKVTHWMPFPAPPHKVDA